MQSLRQVLPLPYGRESARDIFYFFFVAASRACKSNGTRVTSSFGDSVVDHGVCLKTEYLSHTILSNESGEFYTTVIYRFLNRSVCLSIGSPTWWRFSFCLSGSCLVFWWHDAPLVREFQMWGHRCKQWVSRWFQAHKMRSHGIWSIMSS